MSHTAFLVSTDEYFVQSITTLLEDMGVHQVCVFDYSDAEANLQFLNPALVICHLQEANHEELATKLATSVQKCGANIGLLAISEDFSAQLSLRLVKHGFRECLSRPIDRDRVRFWVNILFTSTTRFTSNAKKRSPGTFYPLTDGSVFSCHSPATQKVLDLARRVALRETSVILQGESGTGKTLVARMIHDLSTRRDQPFVAINCGALPEQLVESELFGHRKGAFTGAEYDREGKFSAAGQGTLFLDEVDTLPVATQAKLLRALDQRVFEPVGSNESLPLKSRIISATNASLAERRKTGEFRTDLYFRLSVVEIRLPALREATEEIVPLVEYHLTRLAKVWGQPRPRLASDVIPAIEAYPWPGNIRELINTMEHVLTMCDSGVISLADFPETVQPSSTVTPSLSAPTTVKSLKQAREVGEKQKLVGTLREAGNNRTLAAKLLGISRVSLYKKLHKYDLVRDA